MKPILNAIYTNLLGFQQLIRFYHEAAGQSDDRFTVDLSGCSWLDANMCAALGALLTALQKRITFAGMRPGLEEILEKNGFLPGFEPRRSRRPDTHGTTIEYRRFDRADSSEYGSFDRTDIRGFMGYVARQFEGKGLPQMTPALRRRFRESIAELFENAMEHSETQHGVFACGQWYPRKHRLDFSVADLGIGICERIQRSTGKRLTAERAIAWAASGDNTTRQPGGGKPGGLGLKLIKEFINLNGGSIQIVSDRGYWRFQKGQEELRRFDTPFPGTVVNIEIDTADRQSYRLSSEIDPTDIPF